MQLFPIARMSPLILGLTVLLFPLPALFLGIGLFFGGPARPIMLGVGALIVLLWIGIWVYARPRHFEVSPAELVLVWPIRRTRIPRSDVASARVMNLALFRAEFGNTIRVGAGGLFGTFGRLWSRRAGWMDVWVTNLGDWVVIERRSGRPLVLSPRDPEALVEALTRS
jgi:hypothetical protein